MKTLMERGLKKSFELGPGKVHKTLKFFPLFLLNYASDFFILNQINCLGYRWNPEAN